MKNILITGSAGFIGFHLTKKLLKNKNFKIIGIDNINNYYDVKLKKSRLNQILDDKNFSFIKCNLQSKNLSKNLKKYKSPLFSSLFLRRVKNWRQNSRER